MKIIRFTLVYAATLLMCIHNLVPHEHYGALVSDYEVELSTNQDIPNPNVPLHQDMGEDHMSYFLLDAYSDNHNQFSVTGQLIVAPLPIVCFLSRQEEKKKEDDLYDPPLLPHQHLNATRSHRGPPLNLV